MRGGRQPDAIMEKFPAPEYRYQRIFKDDLIQNFNKLPSSPLLGGEDDIRLSLAGAQNKIAVTFSANLIFITLEGAPSTHTLKPAVPSYEGFFFNEAFCMSLASKIGIPTAVVETRRETSIT